ncbi:MAG: PAS domain-containing protein [Verrucomicrobiota bacterium]
MAFAFALDNEGNVSRWIYQIELAGKGPSQAQVEALTRKTKAILQTIPDLILLLDKEQCLIDIAAAVGGWSQDYAPKDKVGIPASEAWPALAEPLKEEFGRALDKQITIQREFEDGDNTFRYTLSPTADDEALVLVQNLTEEKARQNTEAWRKVWYHESDEAVLLTDADGSVLEVNQAATHVFESNKSELLGKKLSEIYDSGKGDFHSQLERAIEEDGKWQSVSSALDSKGERTDLKTKILPVYDSGEIRHMIAIASRTSGGDSNSSGKEAGTLDLRDHVQSLTSLSALESNSPLAEEISQKWQLRLRSVLKASESSGEVLIIDSLNELCREAHSVMGHRPGGIEIEGDENCRVDNSNAATFLLLCSEVLRLVFSGPPGESGKPEAFIDVEQQGPHKVSLHVRPGEGRRLFSPEQSASAQLVETLTRQLDGTLEPIIGEDINEASFRLVIPGITESASGGVSEKEG